MAAPTAAEVASIRDLLKRFPEDETTVRDLIQRDPTFAELCQEYRQLGEEIEQLRKRHEQVEEGLLTRIEGYMPV